MRNFSHRERGGEGEKKTTITLSKLSRFVHGRTHAHSNKHNFTLTLNARVCTHFKSVAIYETSTVQLERGGKCVPTHRVLRVYERKDSPCRRGVSNSSTSKQD